MAFVRVPGNPEPVGAEELWLEGRGGVRLRAMLAPAPGGASRGTVIVCPGRTEFIEKYFEVACELQARSFGVLVLDWRGQGLSDRPLADPQKGHFASFDDPVGDLALILKSLSGRLAHPWVILAHSMGGAIALRALQTRRVEAAAAVFCAPMWGIASLGDLGARFARFMSAVGAGGAFAPGVERRWKREPFKKNPVTHDSERHTRTQGLIAADTRLALAGPTLGWVAAAADAMEGFRQPNALAHIRIPVTVLSAQEEVLVDNASHGEVAKALPNAMLVSIAHAKHEIMMETDEVRAVFWEQFDALCARMAPSKGAVASP